MSDEGDVKQFLAFRGQLEGLNWEAPVQKGRRAELLSGGPSVRAPCLRDEVDSFSWEDIDEGPPETDDSWTAFGPPEGSIPDGKLLAGGKKLTREQKQKMKDPPDLECSFNSCNTVQNQNP